MEMSRKKACLIISTCVLLFFVVAIGPLDVSAHGFFCDVVDLDRIPGEDRLDHADLAQSDVEVRFRPLKRHFKGFMFYFSAVPGGGGGTIRFTILDRDGEPVDEVMVDIDGIPEERWYRVYTDKGLKKDQVYTLRITAQGHQGGLCLQRIDPGYLGKENLEGDILIGYAYAEPTFVLAEKVLLILSAIAVWLLVASWLAGSTRVSHVCRSIGLSLFLTVVLSWNFMFGSMDNKNTAFAGFQADSETLVTGVICAERDGVRVGPYGLGRYTDVLGGLTGYSRMFLSDGDWEKGYSKTEPRILVVDSDHMKDMAVVGGYVQFTNGPTLRIEAVEPVDQYRMISLQIEKPLRYERYGDLSDIRFLDADKQPLAPGQLKPYISQVGLQGKVFRYLARHIDPGENCEGLHLLCSVFTAVVFVLIVILIYRRYDLLFAACFFGVFWLSPWVVNFARNLYWVEATWFIPMLIGLFCSWKIQDKKCRVISYIGSFIAITGKCLCGYEYISTIMMGMITFLLVDLIVAVSRGDKEKCGLLSRTIAVMGLAALAGFMAAIAIHAKLRGAGDIIKGIKDIFLQDVLRRVGGGDMNEFAERYWPSLNASVWEVYRRYLHFSTEIVTGVDGELFPLLCIVPLMIFWHDRQAGRLDLRLPVMYGVSFLTTISWFILAKAHSYIHTHINYVLWYFGFTQVCFYVICDKIRSVVQKREKDGEKRIKKDETIYL